ncbi:MAG: hypothetical protein ACR2QH_16475 [Geminicoccaceae bacterium]
MTSVMVAAAAAEDVGSGHLILLPERPALSVKPAFAERQSVSSETALAKPERQSDTQRRKPTWKIQGRKGQGPRIQGQAPKAVVILNGTASPLDRALVQQGAAVAPDGAAWPVIILAAGEPVIGEGARKVEFDKSVFKADPDYKDKPYEREAQVEIYGGKTAVGPQRPIIELGTPFYDVGPLGQGTNIVGGKNLIFGHLYAFGDWRTAVAYNDNGNGNEVGQVATRLNLDVDLGLTATERLHALFQPLQKDGQFTRCEFAGDNSIDDCELEYEFEPQTAFFEGDIGAITAGITGSYNSIDLPITGGFIPLIFQNGVWLEDAFIGGAASLPSVNSKTLDISNADFTLFGGFDKVTAPGVIDAQQDVADSNVNIIGLAAFVETLEGYIEAGYAYIDAEDALDGQDYHSATAAYTARYGGWLSNSLRVVGSFGQKQFGVDGNEQDDEQNGVIFLAENSFITSKPYTLLPYANFFVGIERPVPAADATGFLRNTGINFESDALTGFPFLDDSGQNAYGGAIGLQYLFDLQQQLVFEVAATRDLDDISDSFDEVVGNQYAAGIRYQIPLSNAWLLRADAIYA